MSEREERVRPEGLPRFQCTPDFVTRLVALLDTTSAVVVAAAVSAEIGHDVHPSGLHKLKSGTVPTSVLVGPLCRIYGWPVPPLADAEAEGLGVHVAAIYELRKLDPAWAKEFTDALEERVRSARRIAELRRGTPENSEK